MAHVDCCDPTAPPRQFPLPTTNPLPISTARHGRKSPARKITLLCRKRDKIKYTHSDLIASWCTATTCNTTIISHSRIAPWNTATGRGTDDNLRQHTRKYRPSTEESSNLQLFATSCHFPQTLSKPVLISTTNETAPFRHEGKQLY